MKVGFTIEVNEGLESIVYDHFGSAPAFLIVDMEQEQTATVDNSDNHQVHGACNPAAALGSSQIDTMVVGGIGAGAIMKLNAMGVRVFQAGASSVKENIALLRENKLREVSPNDVCVGHQGQCGH